MAGEEAASRQCQGKSHNLPRGHMGPLRGPERELQEKAGASRK